MIRKKDFILGLILCFCIIIAAITIGMASTKCKQTRDNCSTETTVVTTIVEETSVSTETTTQIETTKSKAQILKEKTNFFLTDYSLEAEMIAKVMYQEARGISDKAQVAAVGWCILNRVDDPDHPNTIIGVITQPNQFAWYEYTPVKSEFLKLANDVLARWYLEKEGKENVGRTLPKEYCFFVGDGEYNYFRENFHSVETWDWSYPSPY